MRKWFKILYGTIFAAAASVTMAVAAFAEGEASQDTAAQTQTQTTSLFGGLNKNSIITIVLMLALVAVMYFVMIRPQRKKEKETAAMRNNIQPGDKVVTIGGVVGKVCSVKEDVVTIETGSDKVRIKFVKNAISSVTKARTDVVETKEERDEKKRKVLRKVKKSDAETQPETAPAAEATDGNADTVSEEKKDETKE